MISGSAKIEGYCGRAADCQKKAVLQVSTKLAHVNLPKRLFPMGIPDEG
jgi:hypothetical protein